MTLYTTLVNVECRSLFICHFKIIIFNNTMKYCRFYRSNNHECSLFKVKLCEFKLPTGVALLVSFDEKYNENVEFSPLMIGTISMFIEMIRWKSYRILCGFTQTKKTVFCFNQFAKLTITDRINTVIFNVYFNWIYNEINYDRNEKKFHTNSQTIIRIRFWFIDVCFNTAKNLLKLLRRR